MVSASKKKLDLDISPIRQEMDIGSIVWLWMVEQESKKSNAILEVVLNAIKEHGVSVTEKETFVPRPRRIPAINFNGSLKHSELITNSDSESYMNTVRELIPIWGYQDVYYAQSQSYEYDMDLLTKADFGNGIGVGNSFSCVENAKSWIDDNYPDYDFDVLRAGEFANKFVNLDDLIGALDKDGIDHPYMRGKSTKNTVASSNSNESIPSEKNNCSGVKLSPEEIAKNGGHEWEDYDEFKLLCIVKDFFRLRNGQYVIYGMKGGDSWKSFMDLSSKDRLSAVINHYGINSTNTAYIWSVMAEPDRRAPDRKDLIGHIKEIKKLIWCKDVSAIKTTWFIRGNTPAVDELLKKKNSIMGKQQAIALIEVFKPKMCKDRNKDTLVKSNFPELANRLNMQVHRILSDELLDSLQPLKSSNRQ